MVLWHLVGTEKLQKKLKKPYIIQDKVILSNIPQIKQEKVILILLLHHSHFTNLIIFAFLQWLWWRRGILQFMVIVPDLNGAVMKLTSWDWPVKYEFHGKLNTNTFLSKIVMVLNLKYVVYLLQKDLLYFFFQFD